MDAKRKRIVVVGGGIGGLETISALRASGYDGALTLVAAESHLPYDRPPLSKEVLLGKTISTTLEADWAELDVDLRLGCSATGMANGLLETDGGPIDFDGLAIACGAAPIALPGAASANVRVLRTIDDALTLRAAFSAGARIVVVGAGWIGAEVATAAAAAGCHVTVLEALDAPLAGALPPEIGRATEPWYAECGIDLRLGVAVAGIDGEEVRLAGGESLQADCVVVGIGVRPATAWLAGSGVTLDERGCVVVDASLRTSVPGVVAVGDCTVWESALFETSLHVQHWDNALRAPEVAAATLLGTEATYDPVPSFWSDQLGRMLQYVGDHTVADRLLVRGDLADASWSVCWTQGARLVATLAVGRHRDIVQSRRVIAQRLPVDLDRLSDPDVSVADATAASAQG
jgi:3-phenylpropionate/trans-cinnamate dioxygenase ferredoxin reductase subunit